MTYARRPQNMTPVRSAAVLAAHSALASRAATTIAAATLATAAALATAASPAAALTISGTNVKTLPEPAGAKPGAPVVANAASTDAIYYLDLQASPLSDERFSVRLLPGRMATSGGRDEGQSVDGPLQFTLYGPGQVGEFVADAEPMQACSDRLEAYHGYATGPAEVDVWLPAGARTTLAVRYGIGRRAPWVDTDLRLRFSFQQRLVGSYAPGSVFAAPATSVADAVSSGRTQPIPVVAGKGRAARIGAHLTLSTTPAGRWGEQGTPRSVRRTQPIRVRGRLLPALAGKRVQLQWSRSGGRDLKTAATVRTNAKGRFTATLRPPGTGIRELWAAYPSQSGALRPDGTSCPLRFRVS